MTNFVTTPKLHYTRWPAAVALVLGFSGQLLAGARAQDQSPGTGTSSDGKVRIQVISLKRTEGDTLTLRFQVTNEGNNDYLVVVGNMRLIDIVGRRIYSPGVTSNNCTTPIGHQLTCYAIFGAPPASTKRMAIQFYEKMDLITGVPISE